MYFEFFRALNNCKSNVKLKVVKNCQSFSITTCLRFGRRSVCFMHFFKTQLEMIGNFLQLLIPVNVKTVQMLFNVVWSFLLTVWTTAMRLCAELITRRSHRIPNPSETRGSLFEKVISTRRILVPLNFFKAAKFSYFIMIRM